MESKPFNTPISEQHFSVEPHPTDAASDKGRSYAYPAVVVCPAVQVSVYPYHDVQATVPYFRMAWCTLVYGVASETILSSLQVR